MLFWRLFCLFRWSILLLYRPMCLLAFHYMVQSNSRGAVQASGFSMLRQTLLRASSCRLANSPLQLFSLLLLSCFRFRVLVLLFAVILVIPIPTRALCLLV